MSATLKAGLVAGFFGSPLIFVLEALVPCVFVVWVALVGIGLLAGLLAALWSAPEDSEYSVSSCLPAFMLPALGAYLATIAGALAEVWLFPTLVDDLQQLGVELGGTALFGEVLEQLRNPGFLLFSVLLGNTCCCGLVHVALVLFGCSLGAQLGLRLNPPVRLTPEFVPADRSELAGGRGDEAPPEAPPHPPEEPPQYPPALL